MKKNEKDSDHFSHRKQTLKDRILNFLMIFTQLNERLKLFDGVVVGSGPNRMPGTMFNCALKLCPY